MQTQDAQSRLKHATAARVPRNRRLDVRGMGRTGLGEYCQNYGRDSLAAVVERRHLVPDEPENDGNRVSLCADCHDHAPTAEHVASDRSGNGPADWSGLHATFDRCARDAPQVDVDAVRERDADRCRGCGVRERTVVSDDLHVHPVVPVDGAGHHHVHNYVCLCPTCHRKLHG